MALWQNAWPRADFRHDSEAITPITKALQHPHNQISIQMSGTDFQNAVWQLLTKIPRGMMISYADLARQLGRPHAARAVGGACGANPVPILIPCHRVIASDGSLGGFAGGLEVKQRLLAAETAEAKAA